ncbi:type IV toxin-antitoxin system AbiEi family antitoxin domain-containing protein [Nocardioides lentus]|uniref:Type IV toxin-antitoxin system AbiEi family antitoxin domain-containing protein n=1 Tax=Nocardioides lentus TaxID=338077 RepID=A0ABN2PDH0_9ACTN
MPTPSAAPFLPACFPLPRDEPFTRAQALASGVGARELTRLCRAGTLRRPVPGVYLAAEAGDSLLLRAQALRLVVPPDSVVCDRHAGWLLGAEMALAPGEHVELRPVSVFRPSGHGRLKRGLADGGERNLRPEDVTVAHGIRVTTALRTAHDLGRVRNPRVALPAMDAVARLGRFDLDQLRRGVDRYRGMRWVSTLRAVAPLVDPRAESPPESVLRMECVELGLGFLEPQVEVREDGRLLGRLDLACAALRLAVEYDGVEWHSTPEQQEHDRRRRSHLQDVHGWVFVVVRREHLYGDRRDELAPMLLAGLAEARRRAAARITH